MSIDFAEINNVADGLAGGATEAHWRSAVSRAYYSAYHACANWHDSLPCPGSNTGPGGGVHQQLINRLKNPDGSVAQPEKTKSRTLGPMLEALKIRRHLADYQLSDAVSQREASTAVANAKLIAGKAAL